VFQIPVEEADVEPGTAYEWCPTNRDSGTASLDRTTGYNQVQHFAVAESARAAGTRANFSMAGTFEIHGQVNLSVLEAALLHFVRRHEVLRASYHRSGDGLSCTVVEADDVTLELTERSRLSSRAAVRQHLERAFARVDTLSGPLVVLGAVLRDGSATVYVVLDHLVADAKSVVIAVDDIATAYHDIARSKRPRSTPAGSYLEFSRQQRDRHQAMGATDARLDRWRDFRDRNGGLLPEFPLDLGIEPGLSYPPVHETRILMTARETDALEVRCRAAEARLFMAALTAMAVAQRDRGGPDIYRTLVLIDERGDDRYAGSVGWFINAQPVEIPVPAGADVESLLACARKAWGDARRYSDVHYLPAWGLLAPDEDAQASRWPRPINLFSYMDLRKAPGGEHLAARRARKYSYTARSSSVLHRLFRDHDGLHLNTIHANTPQAAQTQAGLVRALVRTLREFGNDL
jgi:mycolipenoyl-CoA---2-(long-chain-fatty acyl)-trehalose mycolipenoyltransferase / long-chain-acyl-CoA---trehalose acyltransferase